MRAGVRRFEPGDDPEEARLSRAGRAEKGDELAVGNREADVGQRDERAERLRDVAGFDAQAGLLSLRARASSTVFRTSVTRAKAVRSEATANAAENRYSL